MLNPQKTMDPYWKPWRWGEGQRSCQICRTMHVVSFPLLFDCFVPWTRRQVICTHVCVIWFKPAESELIGFACYRPVDFNSMFTVSIAQLWQKPRNLEPLKSAVLFDKIIKSAIQKKGLHRPGQLNSWVKEVYCLPANKEWEWPKWKRGWEYDAIHSILIRHWISCTLRLRFGPFSEKSGFFLLDIPLIRKAGSTLQRNLFG